MFLKINFKIFKIYFKINQFFKNNKLILINYKSKKKNKKRLQINKIYVILYLITPKIQYIKIKQLKIYLILVKKMKINFRIS